MTTTNAAGIGIQDIRKPGDFRIPSRLMELLERGEFDGVEDCVERFMLEAFPDAVDVRLPRTETLAIGEMRSPTLTTSTSIARNSPPAMSHWAPASTPASAR